VVVGEGVEVGLHQRGRALALGAFGGGVVDEVAVREDHEELPVLVGVEDVDARGDEGGFLALKRGDGVGEHGRRGDHERMLVDGGEAETEGIRAGLLLLGDLTDEFDETPGGGAADLGLLEAVVLGELGEASRVEVAAEDEDELEIGRRGPDEGGVLWQRGAEGDGLEVAFREVAQAGVLDRAEGLGELGEVALGFRVGLDQRLESLEEVGAGLVGLLAFRGEGELGPDVGRGGEALGQRGLGLGLAATDEQEEREEGQEAAHGLALGQPAIG